MSDFLIVFAVGILGLIAQAAGGKTVRRLVTVSAKPVTTPQSSSGVSESESSLSSSKPIAEAATAELKPEPQPTEESAVSEPASGSQPTAESANSESADEASASTEATAVTSDEASASTEATAVTSDEASASTEATAKTSDEASPSTEPTAVISEEPSTSNEPTAVTSDEASASTEPTAVTSNEASISSEPIAVISEEPSPSSEPIVVTPNEVSTSTEATTVTSDTATTSAEPTVKASEALPPADTTDVKDTVVAEPAAPVEPPVVREEIVQQRKVGFEIFVRIVITLWFIGLAVYYNLSVNGLTLAELQAPDPWVSQVTFITCALTGFTLIKSFRTLLSYVLSSVDCIFDTRFLKAVTKDWTSAKTAFAADRVFMPKSIPHMVGLFIYLQTLYYLLAAMSPKTDFQMPGMPIPLPLPLDQLFSYNGLGLVMLAFCGCGIFVTRNFKEVLNRLALVKPTPPQIMIGLGLVFMSFLYDWLWSFYTHGTGQGLDLKLSGYNGGTFTAEGGFSGAIILALATAVFAGVGEETLIRGGLQPVFGLVPAAILHGILHAQFQHAPIFIVQVAGWSILMGIVKRYTNTSTTIIGHAGFNFVTSFLFAFNPPDV